jgi:molybdopterin molybdotransferase
MFGEPAVRALQHLGPEPQQARRAALTAAVRSPAGRRSFLRGVLDRPAAEVRPLSGQESHRIAALGRANALIVVPEPVTELAAGEIVEVLELP